MNKYFINNNSEIYKFEKILIDPMTGAYSLQYWRYELYYKSKKNPPRMNLQGYQRSILIDSSLPTLVNLTKEEQIKFIEDNFESFVLHALINNNSDDTELIKLKNQNINTSDQYFDTKKNALDYFNISEDIGKQFKIFSPYAYGHSEVSEFYSGDLGYEYNK